jgi:hypothetical protein
MPPLVISRDNITIGGKIMETVKSVGTRILDPDIEIITSHIGHIERKYPPSEPLGLPGNTDADQLNNKHLWNLSEVYDSNEYATFMNDLGGTNNTYLDNDTRVGFSQTISGNEYQFMTNYSGASNGKFYDLFDNNHFTNWYVRPNTIFANDGAYVITQPCFNNHDVTYLDDGTNIRGIWVELGISIPIVLTKYSTAFADSASDRNIRSLEIWTILGSNNRLIWTIIHDVPGDISSPDVVHDVQPHMTEIFYQTFPQPLPYKYIRKILRKIDTNTWYAQTTFNIYGREVVQPPSITPQQLDTDYKYIVFTNTIPSLLAHYKFDGDFNDSSGYNRHLLPSGTNDPIITSDSKVGIGALRHINDVDTSSFTNGIRNGTLKIPTIDLTGSPFTISLWFKFVNNTDAQQAGIIFLAEEERLTMAGSFEIYTKANTGEVLCIYRSSGGGFGGNIATGLLLNIWYNIVVIISSTYSEAYINGIKSTANFSRNHSLGLPDGIYDTNYLGCFNNDTLKNTSDCYIIDDLHIYNRVLTFTEITSLYTNSSLVAHYKFDDDFKDSSGNNRHLTANQNLPVISNTQFKYGKSSYFTSDSLKLQNVVVNGVLTSGYTFHNKPFSISLWIYQTSAGNFISQNKAGLTNQALHLNNTNGLTYRFGFWSNDLNTNAYSQDLNNWVHLVFQIDSSRRREIWRNGVLETFDTSASFLNTDNANIIIGSWNISYSQGYMDALRIYDRELTETEILGLYNDNDTPKTPYVINFPEETEISLLILDNLKYVETAPFLFSGIANINIGDTTSFDEYNTNTNSTPYNSGYISTITGEDITYNTPQVIIKYKITKDYTAQWTYNSTNPSVYHLGNVGIGTTNPTSALDVIGSVVVNGDISSTSLVANAKNFKIAHPLGLNKSLYHGCVESSRFDNIYRGKKKVINGTCEVDIDNECNTSGGMTSGTFMALNSNFSLYVRNNKTYDRVYGIINGSKITINCENIADEIEIDWLVIGERQDKYVINVPMTTNIGSLICEHDVN